MDRPSQGEPGPERVPESDPVPESPPVAESGPAAPESRSVIESGLAAPETLPVAGPNPVVSESAVAEANPVVSESSVAGPNLAVPESAGPVSPAESAPVGAPTSGEVPAFSAELPADLTQPVPPSVLQPPQVQPVQSQPDEPVTVAHVDPGPGYQQPTYPQYPGYQTGQQPAYPGAPAYQQPPQTGYQPVSVFQPPARPKRERPQRDPLAVALGNASLLSAGYWLLGRRVLALATTAVTVALILVLTLTVQTLWFEIVVVVWWVALIAHGWVLAGGKLGLVPKPDARKHRLVTLGLAVVVLAAFGLLRYDAARIDQDVTAARDAGSCADAQEALDSRWFGHRVANAPLAVEGDDTVRACELLDSAAGDFDRALSGDVEALQAGFDDLATVRDDLPGHDKMADAVLGGFLDELPVEDPCATAALTDALADRKEDGVDEVVTEVAPEALVGCGDDLLGTQSYEEARDRYQQLLDDYPDHDLAAQATEGATKATQAIELANVRSLLQTTSGTQPAYCDNPAPYSGAPPYAHPGPTPAITFGNEVHTSKLPWRVTDVANAVVVICAGETQHGTPQETCPYESSFAIGGAVDVTFFRIAIPVRMYEVRTGKLLTDTIVEIGGASCPNVLEYSTYISDLGPPSETYVAASDADVQNGFRWLFFP